MHDYLYEKDIFLKDANIWIQITFGQTTFLKIFQKTYINFNTYGSFTDFNNKKILQVILHLQYFKIKILFWKKNKKNNLENRYSFYPKNIKKFLNELINKYNLNTKNLNYNSAAGIQLDVITYLDCQKKLLQSKKKLKAYNDFFAVKRSLIFKDKLYGILPKFGFSKLFSKFHNYLLKNGVKINLSSPLLFSSIKDNKLQLKDKFGKKINSDYIIWTGNPTTLVKNICSKDLQSINTRVYQFNFNLRNKNLNNFYIQIFSTKIPLTKIYIYNINDKFKLSVESVSKDIKIKELIMQTQKILNKFKIKLNISNEHFNYKKDTRYNVLSVKDLKILKKLEKNTLKSNLIIPDFSVYGEMKELIVYLKINNKKTSYLIKFRKKFFDVVSIATFIVSSIWAVSAIKIQGMNFIIHTIFKNLIY